MGESVATEDQTLVSPEIKLGENASLLHRQADAVFDGQNLTLGWVARDEKGQMITDAEKQKQQQEVLAQRLNGLKEGDKPIFDEQITAATINQLQTEIQKLFGPDGKFAGIYANFLGDPQQNLEASSLAMVAFLDYLRANTNEIKKGNITADKLLQGAYEQATKVLKAAGIDEKDFPSLAVALVGKDGQVFALNTGRQEIVIIGADGKAKKIGETKDSDGKITVDSSQQMGKEEKIILCSSEAAGKIDEETGKKPVGEIVAALVGEKDPSTAGGKGEEEKKTSQVASEPQQEEPGDRRFIFPRYEDATKTINANEFMKLYPEYVEVAQKIFEKVKDQIPRNPGEKEEEWQIRVWQEIGKRLSLPGFYTKRKDAIHSMLVTDSELIEPLKNSHYLLMATEALQIQLKKQINQQYEGRHKADLERVFRGDVKTVVSHVGEPAYIEGDFDHYFDEHGKIKEGPAKDLLAFDLVADRLLDVPFETDTSGKEITYRERIRQLMAISEDSQKSQEERDRANRQLVALRSNFYSLAIEAIKTRNQPQFINPNPDERQGREKILAEMYTKLKEVGKMNIDQLIDQYQGVKSGISNRNKTRIRNLLTGELPQLFDYALKGGDLMQRRISYELKLPYEIDNNIHYKRLVQGPTSLEELATGGRRVIQGEATRTGRDESSEEPTVENPADLPPGPPKPNESPKPEEPPKLETKPDEPPPAPVPAVSPSTPPEELKTEFVAAIVADPTRVQEEVGALARHYRASEKPTVGLKMFFHPREILRGTFIKNMWKNTFFSRIFDDQAIRFEMGLTEAARKKLGLDSSVPLQLTAEVMDKALEEADKLKKTRSFGRKFSDFFRDIPANVLGIGQNTRMRLAKEWLETQAPKELLEGLKKGSFEDQTAFAQRFTLEERGGLKSISEEIGEVRYLLSERSPQHNTALQGKIKELAASVCTGQKTCEQALVDLNKYFREKIYPNLPPDIKKELSGVELSSNLLGLIDYLQKTDSSGKTNWDRYQEQTEGRKTKWEELQVKIYLGKGRYEAARGDTELTGLQRKLIDRMMERNYAKETGFRLSYLQRGVELAKDVIYYGGSFVGGGLVGLVTRFGGRIPFIFGLQLNPLTATLSTSLAAAAREGLVFASRGRLKGIAGKAWQDFVQVSREAGQGREGIEGARLRRQFEALLVSQESAENLTRTIINLLQKETLTEAEQKQLLLAMAHAQARLRMTDLSTRRGKRVLGIGDIEVPQNFITYHSDKRNEELTALHSAILEGMTRLTGVNSDLAGKLEEVTSVYMAQLRVGSTKEKLAAAITLNNPNVSSPDAQRLVGEVFNQFGEAVDLKIAAEKSLEGSVRRLAGLTWKRAGQTFVMSAIFGQVAKVTLTPVLGEIGNIYHDIRHAANLNTDFLRTISSGDFWRATGRGFSEYISDWQQVVHGDLPIEIVGNQPVVDLSPLQRGVFCAPSFALDIGHRLGLDNLLHYHLPQETVHLANGEISLGFASHLQQADYDGNGSIDTLLIDKRTGEIIADFRDRTIDVLDVDHDGDMELALVSNNPNVPPIDATQELQKLGIQVQQVGEVQGNIPKEETIFSLPAGVDSHEESVGGIKVNTPDGTKWIDNGNGTYDLVGKDIHRNTIVLIDDAKVQGDKIIIDPDKVHQGFQYQLNSTTTPDKVDVKEVVKTEIITGEEAAEKWKGILTSVGKQIWWTNRTVGSDFQELRLYNLVYQDANGHYGVVFQGPTGQGSIDGVNFHQVDQVAAQNGGMQLALFVPGLGHLKIDMDSDGVDDNRLWLDTASDNPILSDGEQVMMPDHTPLTVSKLAQLLINQEKLREHLTQAGISVGQKPVSLAAEYRGWLDVFNLGNGEKSGYIVAGFTDQNNVFNHLATIRGSGDLSWTEKITERVYTTTPGETYYDLSLNGVITKKVEQMIPVFQLTPPEVHYPIPWFIPIPVRENIERSVRGDSAKTTSPTNTQPQETPPSSKPLTTPTQATLTPQERQALERKKEELLRRRDGLQKEIRKRSDGKPTPEQEQELTRINQELAEVEARLKPPSTASAAAELTPQERTQLEQEKARLIQEIDELRKKQNPSDKDKKILTEKERRLAEIEARLKAEEEETNKKERRAYYKRLRHFYRLIEGNLNSYRNNKMSNEDFKDIFGIDPDQLNTEDDIKTLAKRCVIEEHLDAVFENVYESLIEQAAQDLSDEEKTLKARAEQIYQERIEEMRTLMVNLKKETESITDDQQRENKERQIFDEEMKKMGITNFTFDDLLRLEQIVEKLEKKAEELFQPTRERLREEWEAKIQAWEAESIVVEEENHHPKEIKGHSEKGKRDKDEDAYFDGDFHFGESTITGEVLKQTGVLEADESLVALKDKLKQSGLSVSIVADGMGGHGNGEIASAIAVVGLIKQLVQLSEVSEESLRKAVIEVNRYIFDYNNKKGSNSGTTLVTQITDKNGNTWVISIGDSRVYQINDKNECRLLTYDQSLVWSLMEFGQISGPNEIFTHPQKNVIFATLKGKGLNEDTIQVYNLGPQPEGYKLILCCDGVWEGVDPARIPNELITQFSNRIEELRQEGKQEEEARRIAAQEFFGQVFYQIMLGGNLNNLNPGFLTREEITNLSGDNATAVVVKF